MRSGSTKNLLLAVSGDPVLRAELAASYTRVAKITGEIGSPVHAVALFQQAVSQWEKLLAARPDNRNYQEAMARTLNELGVILMHLKGRA